LLITQTGQRFPTLAAARSILTVNGGAFINNTCTVARCHTPGIYVTEGARCGHAKHSDPRPTLC
jgi:hypothetical protein